jgi:hypothetical protein
MRNELDHQRRFLNVQVQRVHEGIEYVLNSLILASKPARVSFSGSVHLGGWQSLGSVPARATSLQLIYFIWSAWRDVAFKIPTAALRSDARPVRRSKLNEPAPLGGFSSSLPRRNGCLLDIHAARPSRR